MRLAAMERVQFERYEWLDIIRGIGIICVVVGHVAPQYVAKWIYIFHMPLFFVASGLTHSRKNTWDLARQRADRLLRPYFSYLLILLLIPGFFGAVSSSLGAHEILYSIMVVIGRFLLGGRFLVGILGVFWFVTCLYITQVLYSWLESCVGMKKIHLAALIFIVLAYMNQMFLPSLMLPWNANVVFFAFPLFHIGCMAKRLGLMAWRAKKSQWLIALAIMLGCLLVYVLGGLAPLDMKNTNYGIPVFGFLVAIGCVFILKVIACQWMNSTVGGLLREIGQRSMTIMFIHQLVHVGLEQMTNMAWSLVAVVSLLLPCLAHEFIKRSNLLSFYLLGANRLAKSL